MAVEKNRKTWKNKFSRKWKKFLTSQKRYGNLIWLSQDRNLDNWTVKHMNWKFFYILFLVRGTKTVKGLDKLESLSWPGKNFYQRVWSWLRMNAGGVPNTCKSSEALASELSGEEACDWAADGWVTRREPASHRGITVRNDC